MITNKCVYNAYCLRSVFVLLVTCFSRQESDLMIANGVFTMHIV